MTDGVGNGIRRYLITGEKVLWEGHPAVGPYSLRGWWFSIPVGFVWTAMGLVVASSAVGSASLFLLVVGVPFLLLGLYMLGGYILVGRREARQTTYAITAQRVLILTGAFRTSLTELDLLNMAGVVLREGRRGSGSITFAIGSPVTHVTPGWSSVGTFRMAPAFQSIDDVLHVFEILQGARAELRASLLSRAESVE